MKYWNYVSLYHTMTISILQTKCVFPTFLFFLPTQHFVYSAHLLLQPQITLYLITSNTFYTHWIIQTNDTNIVLFISI